MEPDNITYLQEIVKDLEKRISCIKDIYNDYKPIQDGIVNINEYLKAPVRIMWVLKEANSVEDGWDQREAIDGLRTENGIKSGWRSTFEPIIYSSFGIINNKEWDDINNFDNNNEIIDIVKQIAFINVKKISGGSTAKNIEIQNYFDEYHELLIDQINLLKPQIVIFGNTMKYFSSKLNFGVKKYNQHLSYAFYENKLLIDVWHPNYITRGASGRITKKQYFDYILDICRRYKDKTLEI